MIVITTLDLALLSVLASLFVAAAAFQGTPPLTSGLAEADSVFQSREYERARGLYLKLVEQARIKEDSSRQTEALSQVARCYLIAGDPEAARYWLEQARVLATPILPLGWSRYLGVKGRLEWKTNDLAAARQTFKDQFNYCREHSLTDRAIDAVHMIAIVGNPDEQVEWGLLGIAEAETAGEKRWLGPLWNNLAITYSDQNDYQKSYDAFLKAREYHWQFGDEIGKLYADYHVGWVLRMKGDYDLALTWLRPSLAWAERLEFYDVMAQATQDMGEIFVAKGDRIQGLEYLSRALGYFKKAGYEQTGPDILSKLSDRIAELSGQ
jgi:tetratricopeptide (TPR) repeat protein